MLLFQFPGVAEEWLARDDFANLRSFVFDTAAPQTFPPEDREVFCTALGRDGRLTAALNYYRANIPPETWLKPPPDLPPVQVPTTIIWGEADAYMSGVLLERSVKKVAGPLHVERLPGVSHWVQQEVPRRVNELLVAALERGVTQLVRRAAGARSAGPRGSRRSHRPRHPPSPRSRRARSAASERI